MAALQSNQLAVTTARSGLARCGVTRASFVPLDIQSIRPGTGTPSTGGAFYVWRRQEAGSASFPSTTWTAVER